MGPRGLVLAAVLVVLVDGQAMGDGISKYTLPCNDPVPRLNWLENYLPVVATADSCLGTGDDGSGTEDVCLCNSSEYGLWEEAEARVQLYHQKGFGIHLVNSSGRVTTGGMDVAAAEALFEEKLDGSAFDAFYDYNVGLYLPASGEYSLDGFLSKLEANSEPYLGYAFARPETNATYYGLFVRAPSSMLVLELVSNVSSTLAARSDLTVLEPRVSEHVLSYLEATPTNYTVRPIHVSRATSNLAAVDAFYTAIRVARTVEYVGANVSRTCYLWGGAEVEVCYVERPATATSGLFTVEDFEASLNAVHEAVVAPNPNCQRDKWTDFHYAYDNGQVSGKQIYEYVALKPDAYFVCTGAYVMYVVDPAGFAVQLDINGDYTLSTCDDSDWDWGVDQDHGSCVLGNCSALPPNRTLSVVALSSLLAGDDAAADDDGGTPTRTHHARHPSATRTLLAKCALVGAAVFVLCVVLYTASAQRLALARRRRYSRVPDDFYPVGDKPPP